MKTKIYCGDNPSQFHPCVISRIIIPKSIKEHPATLAMRNKRKRMRFVRQCQKQGITRFLAPAWEISEL